MLVPTGQAVAIAFMLAPLASAAMFPKDTLVKMIDAKEFRQAMKANQTSMVAFIANWCGHCQRMAPEYSKAALGLHPLLPVYAVDCALDPNKRLCAEQDVQGFPTVKLFPRGGQLGSMTYDSGQRTASAFFYWASRRVPNTVTKFYKVGEIQPWVEKTSSKHRALLLTKDKKVPLLWKVLGNKYKDQLELSTHRDRKGKSSVTMGLEAGDRKQAKVLLYPAGSTKFVRYEGIHKLDSLSKFFDSVLDGTADLSAINEEAKAEEFTPSEEELEIQRKQEAQRIALAHGGFSDIIDFEKVIKEGGGANYHDVHGYPGMMGSPPKKADAESKETAAAATDTQATPAAENIPTGYSEQVVLEKKDTPVLNGGRDQCSYETAGPGAEPPSDCSSRPPEQEHPKDEL